MSRFLNDESLADFVDSKHQSLANHNSQLLFIDILNFTEFFFPLRETWNITKGYSCVKRFVEAARNSGWDLKVFIDDTTPSAESASKWKTRRSQEIKRGQKNMPFGLSVLIGDMFRSCGVDAIYSDILDNDDTMAACAEVDGASILSDDKDFFRYIDSTFNVYGGYEIRNNQLVLKHKTIEDVPNLASSMPLPEKPSTFKYHASHVCEGVYKRGTATPLTRALNLNLQQIITPLRRAFFVANGVQGPITELWPYWHEESQSVMWHQEDGIYPESDDVMSYLLTDPNEAVDYFFAELLSAQKPEDVKYHDWAKHLFCMRGIVYELCATETNTLLDMWLAYERSHPVASRGSSGGRGGGGGRTSGGGRNGGYGGRHTSYANDGGGRGGYSSRGGAARYTRPIRDNTGCLYYNDGDEGGGESGRKFNGSGGRSGGGRRY